MDIKYLAQDAAAVAADALALFVPQYDKAIDSSVVEVDRATRGAVASLLQTGEFTGKEGQHAVLVNPEGFKARRIVLLGLGESAKVDSDTLRRAAGRASVLKAVTAAGTVAFAAAGRDAQSTQAIIEGYLLGGWQHLEFKSGSDTDNGVKTKHIVFITDDKKQLKPLQAAVERGRIIAEGQLLVRQLANTPANHLTPVLYAKRAQALAKEHGVAITVLDEAAIKREKMGALLAVAQGSEQPPRFIVLKHSGGRPGQKPIVLVGKGVTFDTGGISLKQAQDMHEMKGDMTGSAIVLATMITAARLDLPLNVVGLMPLAENMPSGRATRPGDIVTSRKGKTIEIINTDAEGRLLLADALDYANTFKPEAVIDIATLTGATLYILGYAGAPIMGNNDALLERIREASKATAERVWPLPIWDDMREQMKSPIADLTNSGGKPAGTIAAAAFLENFIGDWPWAHIDIAYVDVEKSGRPYIPRGITGIGLRLLVELLADWKKL